MVQTDGFGIPEGSLRRKQQIKIANSKTIRTTRPAILLWKKKETKSVTSDKKKTTTTTKIKNEHSKITIARACYPYLLINIITETIVVVREKSINFVKITSETLNLRFKYIETVRKR